MPLFGGHLRIGHRFRERHACQAQVQLPPVAAAERTDPAQAEFIKDSFQSMSREATRLAGGDAEKLQSGVRIDGGPVLASLQKLHGASQAPGMFALVSKAAHDSTWTMRLRDEEGNVFGKSQYEAGQKSFMNLIKAFAYAPTNEASQKMIEVVKAHGAVLEALGKSPDAVDAKAKADAVAAVEKALGESGLSITPGNSLVTLDRSGHPIDFDKMRCQLNIMKGEEEAAHVVILKDSDRPVVTLLGEKFPLSMMMSRE